MLMSFLSVPLMYLAGCEVSSISSSFRVLGLASNCLMNVCFWHSNYDYLTSPFNAQCAEAVLGPDPTQGTNLHEEGSDARRSVPAGLRNLGATCYVSSVLQCLEMNTPFRTAVLGLPKLPPAADVLSKLQELFARLHFGLHKVGRLHPPRFNSLPAREERANMIELCISVYRLKGSSKCVSYTKVVSAHALARTPLSPTTSVLARIYPNCACSLTF